jgi:hypothetical protein
MKIIITENQYGRLFESTNLIDKLNKIIESLDFNYNYDLTNDSVIIPSKVIIEGDIDDINVRVTIDKVIYKGSDVTDFARNYALWSGDYDSDPVLAVDFKSFVVEIINLKVLRLINQSISEYDVILDL